MIRAAVIGLGDIAPIHCDAIKALNGVQLAAVCDIEPAKQNDYHSIPFYTDYLELMEREKPDCVHVCLPHNLHYPVAMAAAQRGIHVFCEKPAAVNREQAAEFVRLEAEYPEVRIGICLQNRKNHTVMRLEEIIKAKDFGKILGISGFVPWMRPREYYDDKPWRGNLKRAGSGVMLNQSIHTLDLMYYLGGEISKVKAISGQLLDYDIEVEDTVAASLIYRNCATGLFFATNANHKNDSVSIQARLEKGEFLIRNNVLYQVRSDGGYNRLAEDQRLPGTKFYYGAGHQIIVREFYLAIQDNTDNYIHVKDSWPGMAVADAIFQSSRMKKTVSVML